MVNIILLCDFIFISEKSLHILQQMTDLCNIINYNLEVTAIKTTKVFVHL